jgi:tetratricopeptide (TPR) repeat protein
MERAENNLGAFLVNNFGDRYLYNINRNAFNAIGSDALYTSMYGEKLFTEYQINIIIGTDSGIFPNFIDKHGIPTGSRFLFIEIPEVIDILSHEGMLENLPPEICITTLDSWAAQAEIFQLKEYIFFDSVHVCESLASNDANMPEYRDLSWKLNLDLKTVLHKIRTAFNCAPFILRQLENLAENRVSFAQTLVGAFSGRTAIILAGGPSLREALPWVRENRDRILIIAVSRISRILLDEGIVPHIIVSVDPQTISFEVSREMLSFAEGDNPPLFIYSHHASPLLVGQWGGKSLYTDSLFPWPTPLNCDSLSYSGPTVSNYALSLTMHMGCETIVLAGVDLCFSPEGQTHAEGSNENKVGPDLGQLSPRIETYGGLQADTNQGYAHSLQVLGIQAQLATALGHHLYNCSQKAAKVPYINFKPLDGINIPDFNETISEIISSRIPEPTSQERLAHYRLIRKELERARRKFQEILTLSQEALKCNDGLFGRNGMQRDFRHKIRMDKIERKLDRSYADFSLLVKRFGLKKFLKILKNPKDKKDWTDEQIETATRDYYEAYVEGTEQLIGIVDGTLQRIDARIEEEKETPDFARVFSQLEKDGHFGRMIMWSNRSPDKMRLMTSVETAEFQRLKQNFQCIMTEEQTSQIKLLEELHDVRHTRSKALLLFKRGEIQELETMANGLSGHPDQEKALPYLHFVRGLVAELGNDPGTAAAHYQQLLGDPPHSLAEDALLQIASLSISCNDIDNAILAVECLVGLSPAYLSPYGDLLKAIGRYEESFNAYNRYLAKAPDDVGVMMKLGIFCREAGLVDTAGELLQKVLEKDENNTAAQTLLEELNATSVASSIQ